MFDKKHLQSFAVFVVGIFFTMSVFTSCSSVISSSKIKNLSTNFCEPTIEYNFDFAATPNQLSTQQINLLQQKLSPHDLLLGQTIGINPYICTYLENSGDTLQMLLMKQKINERINLTLIEIDAIASELDCYAERLDQLSNYVNALNDRTQKRITIFSVALDAATTAAAIFTDNPYLAVGGGLSSIALGALTISPKGKKVEIPLKRNLLKNIWYNINPGNEIPPSVWRILNNPNFSNETQQSMREGLKERWMQFEFENDIDVETEKRFFDQGGLYTADDLHTRVHMIKELEALINTIKQDIRSLSAAIGAL